MIKAGEPKKNCLVTDFTKSNRKLFLAIIAIYMLIKHIYIYIYIYIYICCCQANKKRKKRKFIYNDQGNVFDDSSLLRFGSEFDQNVVIFDVGNTLWKHSENISNIFSVLDERPTDDI